MVQFFSAQHDLRLLLLSDIWRICRFFFWLPPFYFEQLDQFEKLYDHLSKKCLQ